jgi:hypothetical protein
MRLRVVLLGRLPVTRGGTLGCLTRRFAGEQPIALSQGGVNVAQLC